MHQSSIPIDVCPHKDTLHMYVKSSSNLVTQNLSKFTWSPGSSAIKFVMLYADSQKIAQVLTFFNSSSCSNANALNASLFNLSGKPLMRASSVSNSMFFYLGQQQE